MANAEEEKPNLPVYLDYNGMCPMDVEVRELMNWANQFLWKSPSSPYGKDSKDAIEAARKKVAAMINATSEEIVFTSGGTESNCMIIYSAVQEYRQFKEKRRVPDHFKEAVPKLDDVPHFIVTSIEHSSVLATLDLLERNGLCQVTKLQVEYLRGTVSEYDIKEVIRPNTILVMMIAACSETGVLQPVNETARFLKEKNVEREKMFWPPVTFHTDACQTIGKIRVDVRDSHVDYMTIVGQKFYGPPIGALFVRKGAPIHPMFHGGQHERNPRPGTESTSMIVGLGKAAELVVQRVDADKQHFVTMREKMESRLVEVFGKEIKMDYRNVQERLPNTLTVTFVNLRNKAADVLCACKTFIASTGTNGSFTTPSPGLLACGISKPMALRTIRFSVGRPTRVIDLTPALNELIDVVGKMEREPH